MSRSQEGSDDRGADKGAYSPALTNLSDGVQLDLRFSGRIPTEQGYLLYSAIVVCLYAI